MVQAQTDIVKRQKKDPLIEVSIIVPCYNDEQYIEDCLSSILSQTYGSFELFVINDGSTDKSLDLIKAVKDNRIVLMSYPNNKGVAYARNLALSKARGDYLFFTDSDCIVDKEWIRNGLEAIKGSDWLGLEGKTLYVSEDYEPTISDKLPGDVRNNQQYMTCNMVYKREAFDKAGGFDTKFIYHSDREFALRVLKFGNIAHSKTMKVIHQEKKWAIKTYLLSARRIEDRIMLIKYHGDQFALQLRVLMPLSLIKIIVPPLAVIRPILSGKVRTWNDLKLVPFIYSKLVYERFLIWKTALKKRILII
jgi:glycosyltransferase involved in cell wall biosynthesis